MDEDLFRKQHQRQGQDNNDPPMNRYPPHLTTLTRWVSLTFRQMASLITFEASASFRLGFPDLVRQSSNSERLTVEPPSFVSMKRVNTCAAQAI
jgi:hypothetical protein